MSLLANADKDFFLGVRADFLFQSFRLPSLRSGRQQKGFTRQSLTQFTPSD